MTRKPEHLWSLDDHWMELRQDILALKGVEECSTLLPFRRPGFETLSVTVRLFGGQKFTKSVVWGDIVHRKVKNSFIKNTIDKIREEYKK